jgi:ADP-heptose:LPS heptosyltransferase
MEIPQLIKAQWRKIYGLYCWGKEWLPLILWLILKCVIHRKRAVIFCRCGAMGDVVCTLPLITALKEKYPDKLIIFVTASIYTNLVRLSKAPDGVYGSKIWNWDFRLSKSFNVMGLVERVYNPLALNERTANFEGSCHFIDDIAQYCGLTLSERQPKLYPSDELVRATKIKFGVSLKEVGNKKIIAINGGPTWPVRMWETSKWQTLIDHIHAEYDALILLFGHTQNGVTTDLERLKGVKNLFNSLKPEEILALIYISDLVVAIDSGPVHLAGSVGTPVVGLFGPVDSLRLYPDSPSIGVVSNVPCLYCHHQTPIIHRKTGCPHDIECMKQINENMVFSAIQRTLLNK